MESGTELLISINTLTSRITFLAGLLVFIYFSIIVAFIVSYFKGLSTAGPLGNADDLYERADYESLIAICNDVILERPNEIDARWYLALCFYQQGKYTQALEQFNEVERVNPNWDANTEPYKSRIADLQNLDPLKHH